jgi:hypothetical protein
VEIHKKALKEIKNKNKMHNKNICLECAGRKGDVIAAVIAGTCLRALRDSV